MKKNYLHHAAQLFFFFFNVRQVLHLEYLGFLVPFWNTWGMSWQAHICGFAVPQSNFEYWDSYVPLLFVQ